MIFWLLFAWLLPLPATTQSEPAVPGCEGMKGDTFLYIGGQQPTTLSAQRFVLKKIQGRSVVGIPIPGGRGSGPRHQVQVARKQQAAAVAEAKPLFHLSSKTPVERIV